MAKKNGKSKKSSENNDARVAVGDEGTADAMGNRDSKDSIKFSSWSQTDNDVTIILHTGRNFSSTEISVDFTEQNVKVGLTDGRKWSCWFNQAVVKDSARVQLKKMKLLLIVKKKDPGVYWTSYEKVDDDSSSMSESDCSAKGSTCFEIKSLIKAKSAVSDSDCGKTAVAQITSELPPGHAEHSGKKSQSKSNPARLNSPDALGRDARLQKPLPQIGSGDEATVVDSAKSLASGKTMTAQPLPFLMTGENAPNFSREVTSFNTAEMQPRDVVSSSDGQSMTPTSFFDNELISEAVESMDYEETDSLLSSPPLVPDASNCQPKKDAGETIEPMNDLQTGDDEASELSHLVSCEENEPKADSAYMTEAVSSAASNMETDETSANVRDLDLVKHDFYEKGDFVVLTVYVKEINKDTLRIIYGETVVEIVFQTSEPKFLHSYEGATADTFFRWKLNLASTIVEDKCNSRLTHWNLVINLFKKVSKKWGNLTALPQMSSASPPTARDTWMPTCQNEDIGSSSGFIRQRQHGTVAFDELSNTFSKANQYSSNGGSYEDGSYTGRKDLTSINKPTCKVSPLTSNYGSSYVTSSSSSFKQSAVVANPGMTGLDNIGNTCFMNSVLQVLANTIDLKDYFLDGTYQREINCENPLGMGGKLAQAFGYLMKVLWTSNQSSFEPSKLKNLVATKQTRFVGFSQHDAEEFMEFLLDGLHEDLNRVQEKPYFADKDITGESDEVIADESWRRHKLRNDSHIVDVFQGQYHSRVVCPVCETVSITFDPFSIIQVPIPKEKKLIRVIFMSAVPSNRPIMFPIQIGVDANVNHLKDALYQRTRVRSENMRILKVSQCQISSEFTPGMSLQEITSRDLLVACTVMSEKDIGEPVREFTVVQRTVLPKTIPPCCNYCHKENSSNLVLKRCTKCYTASYCNQDCQKKDWNKHKLLCQLQGEPVGCPFIISIPESKMTFSYMCSTIESYARYSVNAFQPPPLARKALGSRTSSITSSVSSLSSSISEQSEEVEVSDHEISGSLGETSDSIVLGDSSVKMGSDVPSKEDAASVNKSEVESSSSQPPVRCVLGTPQNTTPAPPPPFFLRPCTRSGTILSSCQRLEDHGTDLLELDMCRSLLVEWKNKDDCTPYVEVETKELEYEECESKFQTGSNANISYNNDITLHDCLNLFTEPEVLHPDQTWFCSKCNVHRQATKEISIWRLPPTLIIHLKRFSFSSMFWRNKIDDKVTFPLSGMDMTPYLKRPLAPGESPPIYDLYGVINHKGDLVGGHYTAFAQCPDPEDFAKSEVGWRYFDDSNVTTFNAKNVNSQYAYVLFYRKRNAGLTFNEAARMKLAAAASDIPTIITNGCHTIKNTAASIRDDNLDDDVLVMDTALDCVVELENVRMESEDEDSGEKVSLQGYADNIEMHFEGKDINAID